MATFGLVKNMGVSRFRKFNFFDFFDIFVSFEKVLGLLIQATLSKSSEFISQSTTSTINFRESVLHVAIQVYVL